MDDCEFVHSLNDTAEQCAFVKRTVDCHVDEAWLAYTTYSYCWPGAPALPLVAAVFWVVLLFLVLGITADDFLCPALVVMSRTLRLSDSMAGVTLLAFGNGAPDIISSLAGVQQERPSLVLGELLGAGTFVSSVVAGLVLLLCRFPFDAGPFLRDVIFYLAASFWAFDLLYVGSMTLGHAVGFLSLYVIYILIVVAVHFWKTRPQVQVFAVEEPVQEEPVQEERTEPVSRLLTLASDLPPAKSADGLLRPPPSPTWPGERSPSMGSMASDVFGEDGVEAPQVRRRRRSSAHRHKEHVIASILQVSHEGPVERRVSRSSLPEAPEEHIVSETTPLLAAVPTSQDEPETQPTGPWAELLTQLVSWDPADWSERSAFGKVYDVVTFPLRFVLVVTVPVVDYENPKNNWCRPLNTSHCLLAPLLLTLIFGQSQVLIADKLPAWGLALAIGATLALVVWMASSFEREPKYHFLFGYAGFALAVLWIYATARELLGLLRAVGILADISDAVLGLTVLAWGNSLGDLVTNVAVARQGYPTMAIAACFGGPLLNLLLGLGIPYTLQLAAGAKPLPFRLTPVLTALYAGLAASLSLSLVSSVASRFQSSKWHGGALLLLYATFLSIALFVEFKFPNVILPAPVP
ncbi:mitochondrial sodium/calcium exchanger protein [Ixodes scapularis]|uniref:mitochondrial sodium/calcium exchanger protein n=1 Tax=Ixodes scapularis TaxID=6945 RepID=UPI001C383B71|nr:mitochondrial sodium/calcium exchanger protein [Ixodes scapularis]